MDNKLYNTLYTCSPITKIQFANACRNILLNLRGAKSLTHMQDVVDEGLQLLDTCVREQGLNYDAVLRGGNITSTIVRWSMFDWWINYEHWKLPENMIPTIKRKYEEIKNNKNISEEAKNAFYGSLQQHQLHYSISDEEFNKQLLTNGFDVDKFE